MAEILPATLNHEAFDLGIASESHQKAIGIRDPRFAPGDAVVDLVCAEQARFLPIEVAGVMSAPVTNVPPSLSSGPVTVQRIDITLSDGRRILVEGATALSAVVALVTGLAQ
jgi:transposase